MEKLTLKSGRFQRIRAPGREYAPPIANSRRFPRRVRHVFGKDTQKRALNAYRTTRPFFHPLFIEVFSRKSGKFFAKERSKSQWPKESRPEEPMGWNRRPEGQRTQRTEESGRQRPESRKAKGQRKPEGPRKVRGTEGWQRRSPSRQNQRRQTGFCRQSRTFTRQTAADSTWHRYRHAPEARRGCRTRQRGPRPRPQWHRPRESWRVGAR